MTGEQDNFLVGTPGAGQPQNPPETGQGGKPTEEKQPSRYLTEERYQELRQQEYRELQSRLAKETNYRKKLLEQARQQGIQVTPETEQAFMKPDLLTGETPELSTSPAAQSPAQVQTPPAPAQTDWKIQTRDELYAEHGIRLETGDPELGTVDSSTPAKLAHTLDKALGAKKARLDVEAVSRSSRAPAAPVQGGPANPIANITDPSELIRRGLTRK
jgi:hypothetical protein